MKAVLGLDTSCYVTSAALVNESGDVLYSGRHPLEVKQGGLGLRQSEAFFLHFRQLPVLVEEAFAVLRSSGLSLSSVAVSRAPSDCEDSYMPVFLAGLSSGRMLSSSQNVPIYTFSHQQGHLRAAEIGCETMPNHYLGFHLSGGTTEIVLVDRSTWTTQVVCGTGDISAGQWIDRIGVQMGCPFPAGPSLEDLANCGKRIREPIGIPIREGQMSFSGVEAEVKRRLARGENKSDLALEMFLSLSRALCKALIHAHEKTGLNDALIAGGVAANRIVRQEVAVQMLKRCRDLHVQFAKPQFAGDNAVGIALLAMEEGLYRAQ